MSLKTKVIDGDLVLVGEDENHVLLPVKMLVEILRNDIAVKVTPTTDPKVSFANDDAANTQKTITITKPETIKEYHRLIVHNPSAVDLTIKIFNKLAIGTETKQFMGSFIVNAKATVTGTNIETDARTILRDLFLGGSDVELVISNNQAVGAAGAFTATIQLYSL